jgi:hypothetical protein
MFFWWFFSQQYAFFSKHAIVSGWLSARYNSFRKCGTIALQSETPAKHFVQTIDLWDRQSAAAPA